MVKNKDLQSELMGGLKTLHLPTVRQYYQECAQIRCHIEAMLQQLNAQTPRMPDESGRTIHFQLKKKTSKLFAIQNTSKTGFY